MKATRGILRPCPAFMVRGMSPPCCVASRTAGRLYSMSVSIDSTSGRRSRTIDLGESNPAPLCSRTPCPWRSVRVSSPLGVAASLGLANRPLTFRATLHFAGIFRLSWSVCLQLAPAQTSGCAASLVPSCHNAIGLNPSGFNGRERPCFMTALCLFVSLRQPICLNTELNFSRFNTRLPFGAGGRTRTLRGVTLTVF